MSIGCRRIPVYNLFPNPFEGTPIRHTSAADPDDQAGVRIGIARAIFCVGIDIILARIPRR